MLVVDFDIYFIPRHFRSGRSPSGRAGVKAKPPNCAVSKQSEFFRLSMWFALRPTVGYPALPTAGASCDSHVTPLGVGHCQCAFAAQYQFFGVCAHKYICARPTQCGRVSACQNAHAFGMPHHHRATQSPVARLPRRSTFS